MTAIKTIITSNKFKGHPRNGAGWLMKWTGNCLCFLLTTIELFCLNNIILLEFFKPLYLGRSHQRRSVLVNWVVALVQQFGCHYSGSGILWWGKKNELLVFLYNILLIYFITSMQNPSISQWINFMLLTFFICPNVRGNK